MELDEKTLVAQAQAGDRKAFDALVRENKDKMFALLYKMTADRETALDLLQETFLTAYKRLADFRGEAGFSSWLYRIATNKALNHIRRGKIVSFLSFGRVPQAEPAYVMKDRLENTQLQKALAKAQAELPPKQKMVFHLRFHEELPFAEIATILGKSESTVKTNYQRAVEKLRDRLREFK
ncbi:MAG: RNA polymerase sigma factor [candidate division Zixibacteria bacterium]|nr:RNA polymerase sigma factor [candidate division Zixibacteria bacterium]